MIDIFIIVIYCILSNYAIGRGIIMAFRIIKTLLFVALLFNQNIRKNKSVLILISSLIIQNIAISLIILTDIAKLPLNLLTALTTIVFCIDLGYIAINEMLNYFKRTKIN